MERSKTGGRRAADDTMTERKERAACPGTDRETGSLRDQLIRLAKEQYGIEPDCPFRTLPDSVVFRHAGTRKWFGLLMTVRESVLSGEAEEHREFGFSVERYVDILNVRLDPLLVSELRTQSGYHPAYHMNHTNWLTVRLDGSVALSEIAPLLDMSFALTKGNGSGKRPGSGMRAAGASWIIPANPAHYDVAAGFRREETLVWHIRPHVLPGDIVYIYETLPIGAVLFKCEVVEADLPYESEYHPNVHKAMRIRLLRTYPEGQLDRAFLRRCGVTNVRSARAATPEFVRAAAEFERAETKKGVENDREMSGKDRR